MSIVYSITDAASVSIISANVFIMAGGSDERTIGMLQLLKEKENNITSVILFQYDSFDISIVHNVLPSVKIVEIPINDDAIFFLECLRSNEQLFQSGEILIDITSIRIPEMFILLKYLKLLNIQKNLSIAYSTPVEYEFQAEPFTSYRSYYGNLRTIDLVGFGGLSKDMSHTQMIIFLGFEGVLSAKVNEDVQYEKLILVNNLPSFYEKYKDISAINNYDLLGSRHEKMMYVPANNPFETYNFLDEQLHENEPACIAPLSTKPVALGACLYALSHDSLRVVYPMADEYNHHRANSIHNTYLYSVPLKAK